MNEALFSLMSQLQSKLAARPEEGQGMVEYALILALVSVVAIVILMGLGTNVQLVFSSASSALGAAV